VILQTDQFHPEEELISIAGKILKEGGIVIAPTETKYGILGRIDEPEALRRIYQLKKRRPSQPTALFVRSHREIGRLGFETPVSEKLSRCFMPGPLTLVLKDRSGFPPPVVVKGKIGLRFSSSPLIHRLVQEVGVNLSATSANLSEDGEPETIAEIVSMFETGANLYIDSGRLDSLPSTVVDCSGGGYFIARKGAVEASKIKACLEGRND
jgi:L-threonylcarbamoyladenylate synthase